MNFYGGECNRTSQEKKGDNRERPTISLTMGERNSEGTKSLMNWQKFVKGTEDIKDEVGECGLILFGKEKRRGGGGGSNNYLKGSGFSSR